MAIRRSKFGICREFTKLVYLASLSCTGIQFDNIYSDIFESLLSPPFVKNYTLNVLALSFILTFFNCYDSEYIKAFNCISESN